MYNQAQYLNFTVDEYLELELISQIRHEYISGQVYPIAGGSKNLKLITENLVTRLRIHLLGTDCRVFSSDMKVRIEPLNIFYYPELSVTCDQQDRQKLFKIRPCLVGEVISPITERIDRYEKLMNYRELESLQEYLLISESEPKIEIYRQKNQENWFVEILNNSSDILRLFSVSLEMSLADIYQDVEL